MRNGDFKNIKYAAAILLAISTNGAWAAGNVSFMAGKKTLDRTDWAPVQSQTEFGFGVELQKPEWPVAVVASYLSSKDSATVTDPDFGIDAKATAKTTEISLGARKYLTNDRVRFFAEGGLTSISADFSVEILGLSASNSDSAIGFWIGAGVDVMVVDALSVGLLGRMSKATTTLYGIDSEAGGIHFNLFTAYHFDK